MDTNSRKKKKALELLCASVLIAILTAGLWPFHAPKNEVSWLNNGNGLHFGRHGVVLSSQALSLAGSKDGISCTIEIWLRPSRIDSGGTILAFYTPQNLIAAFSVHQSLDDLFLRREAIDRQRRTRTGWYIEHVFRRNEQVIVSITSSTQNTAVYVNGALVRISQRFDLSIKDLTGQLVVGNDPLKDNGWQGQLSGLAIYNRELTAAEVLRHYETWTTNQQAEIKNEGSAAVYLCNEGTGNVVHSGMNSENDLYIPERYFVLHAPFLEVPWDEFQPTFSYCKNVLINIGGFVPFGFFFCTYFSFVQRFNRAVLATIVLGGVVSFSIEVLQAFLPTRDSGMTDIITNTLGTTIGAMLCSCEWVQTLLATVGVGGQRRTVCKR